MYFFLNLKTKRMKNETAAAYGLAAIGATQGLGKYLVEPIIHDTRTSTKAWAVLALGVVTYDLLCPKGETLSEGVDGWLADKPLATIGAIGATTLHLLNVLPKRIDPFYQTLKLVKG